MAWWKDGPERLEHAGARDGLLPEVKDVVVAQGLSDGAAPEFRPVKSAYRALDVLEAMAAGPSTLSDLSRKLGIP